MPNVMQIKFVSVLVSLCLLASTNAFAVDIAYYAGARAAYSDNIRLQPVVEENESPLSVLAGVQVTEESSLMSLSLDSDLQYINYTQNTFSDEILGDLNLDLVAYAIPDRLSWIVTNNWGQLLEDTLSAPSPSNREDVNIFSTGPDLYFLFGKTNRLTLFGRYVDDYYEIRDFDSERVNYGASYVRFLPGERSIGVYGVRTDVDYDSMALTDYNRNDLFLRFESETSKSQFRLDAGYSELERDFDGATDDGILAELEFSRDISGTSKVIALYSYSYSDSGERFTDISSGSEDLATDDIAEVPDPFRLEEFRIGFDRSTGVDNFRLALGAQEEEYTVSIDRDRQIREVEASYSRSLNKAISVGIAGNFTNRDYDNRDREDDDWNVDLFGIYELSRNLDIRLELSTLERSSSGADISSTSDGYDENRAFIEVRYSVGEFVR